MLTRNAVDVVDVNACSAPGATDDMNFDWVVEPGGGTVVVAQLNETSCTATFTIGRRRGEVLNYFDSRLTNGRTEGRNLTIKGRKTQRLRFRNLDIYRLRVLYRCG